MKKKIKDVTIGEMVERCVPCCDTCPLYGFCQHLYPKCVSEELLEEEVDIKEMAK